MLKILNEFRDYFYPLVLILVALFLGVLIPWIVFTTLTIYQKNKPKAFIKLVLDHFKAPIYLFSPLVLLLMVISIFAKNFSFIIDLNHVIQLLLVISFASFLIVLVFVGEEWLKIKYSVDKADNIRERRIRTQALFVKRVVIIFIVFLTIALVLMSFDSVRKLGTGLLASAGVLSVILGFAAQKSLANLLAGFQIAFTQPIRIDDVLFVENEWGRVEEITLTYVVVRLWDQRRLILPIHYFLENPFQNWTRRTAEIIGTVFIYTDYTIDIPALRNELTTILKSTPLWDGVVDFLQVTECKRNTIELRALVSARNSTDAWDLRCYVREKLIEFIKTQYLHAFPKYRIELFQSMAKNDN